MHFSISDTSLDIQKLSDDLQDDGAGAFASFEGWVRNHNEGHTVEALEYEVFHDLAISEGEKVIKEAIDKFGLSKAGAVHREGKLEIGDCAIWIGVTAPHRGEAFDACRYIIDELKHRLPIWKKEHYTDQHPEWVNCKHCHHHKPRPEISKEDFYARQKILGQVGQDGQDLLSKARVLIVGAGGLGSSAALGLAGAGVGTIGIADHDDLSVNNLHRQVLYSANDIGKPKAHLAAVRLKSLNPLIEVNVHAEKVTADNVQSLFQDYDIILDCTDNFNSKYLLNDAAILYSKLLIQASIYQFEGQLLTINPTDEAGCLRCLFDEAPEVGMVGDCATAGVLGTVPMMFGTLQANEAIKYILGVETNSDLMTFDLLSMQSYNIKRNRNDSCPICSKAASFTSLEPNIEYIVSMQDTDQTLHNQFVIIDVREAVELAVEPLSNAHHMPTSNFDIGTLDVSKDQPILVVCAHGVRSLSAAKYLREAGWKKAYSLAGGIENFPRNHKEAAA